MDETDPRNSGNSDAGQAVKDSAQDLKAEAGKVISDVREGGLKNLFSFDKMYFPIFAQYIFVVFVVLTLLVGLGGVVAAFSVMSQVGFSDGLYDLLRALAMVVFMVIAARLYIELALVAFKINDAVQDIRQHIKKLK